MPKKTFLDAIAALRGIYNGDMEANRRYLAYANKADVQGYPDIARLFKHLFVSESVHARNFKTFAADLGFDLETETEPETGVGYL